jgi:4-hydroxyproline epimerase
VPEYGRITGDIAWAGNWFFLVGEHPFRVDIQNRHQLLGAATATRAALIRAQITGENGELIDHIEFFGPAQTPTGSSRNFVLCPGASFDRSPCGTGTSAKMACLYADGKLRVGGVWVQEGILGTCFEGRIATASDGRIHPIITGRAWITAESTLRFDRGDPFEGGIVFL